MKSIAIGFHVLAEAKSGLVIPYFLRDLAHLGIDSEYSSTERQLQTNQTSHSCIERARFIQMVINNYVFDLSCLVLRTLNRVPFPVRHIADTRESTNVHEYTPIDPWLLEDVKTDYRKLLNCAYIPGSWPSNNTAVFDHHIIISKTALDRELPGFATSTPTFLKKVDDDAAAFLRILRNVSTQYISLHFIFLHVAFTQAFPFSTHRNMRNASQPKKAFIRFSMSACKEQIILSLRQDVMDAARFPFTSAVAAVKMQLLLDPFWD